MVNLCCRGSSVIGKRLVLQTTDDPAGSLHQHQPGHHVLQTALVGRKATHFTSPIKHPRRRLAASGVGPEGARQRGIAAVDQPGLLLEAGSRDK
ncbi:hypothetical protein AVEN_257485-1 [Araneus ventricosus]|uniref:Uncharacterized protein n=1 Tax=Araneus ventricosus TaxID=182803 RepID=A0A4Y2LX09_ARAVE|nr:hypothetical protein AVEN_257485-1 [Araneus ventricosus]